MDAIKKPLAGLIQFWPLVLGFIALIGWGVRLELQVKHLDESRMARTKQWERISENTERSTTNSSRLTALEHEVRQVITPDAMREYGQLIGQVEDNEKEIKENATAIRELNRRPR